jgi:tetratricopeptide (TPR) repeat protein
MLKTPISDLKCFLAAWMHLRSALYITTVLGLFGFLTSPAPVAAVASVNGPDDSGMLSTLLIVMLATLVVAALIIIGLIFWSRKQEHIGEMILFCMKYLVHSEDEEERCASARALGQANDSGALLVLLYITLDEAETEAVHKAAREALHEMSVHFRKHKKIITDLELEAEQRNFSGIIGILTANFEQGKTRYVQSAYIIGRHYMRLEHYVEAREWLIRAEFRNRKFNLYGNRIRYWIKACNTRLLKEADDSFKAADYQQAKEHYAILDHGLSDVDRQRFAVYLRSACVYCKLKDYRNADQSLLQALEHNHETELALTLVQSLQKVLSLGDNIIESNEELEEIESMIDKRASKIMNALLARRFRS